MKIVCVCTGNICRSPMLTYLLRDALEKEGIECEVSGAGTGTRDGIPPSAHAITAMQEIGVDISENRSRQMTLEIADTTDLFVALSVEHGVTLAFQYDVKPEKIIVPGDGVPDPYGMDLATYRTCRDMLVDSLPQLVADIKAQL